MKVSEALKTRLTVRAYLDKPVEDEVIREILERSARAPSGGNLQPWKVYVTRGEVRDRIVRESLARLAETNFEGDGTEYNVYPPELTSPYRDRRFKVGEDLYATIGIPREDKPARYKQLAKNYEFFGAPVGLFFAMDRQMQEGQWADLGMFMQSIMLLAREYGLHTTPQEAWARVWKTVGGIIGIPENEMLFAGIALGYADMEHPINSLVSDRAPMDEWCAWVD